VGERSPYVRARACERLGFLGVEVNPALNDQSRQDADISAEGARARTLVVRAREDLEIARQVRAALAGERL
jgi:acetate kinase